MSRVSVVVPTCRREGLQLLFRALAAQTFADFDLVLADEVADRAIPDAPFRVTRVPVQPRPTYALCRTLNAGIAAATGELVAFLYDWSVPSPDWLERHVAYHKTPSASAGPYTYHPTQKPPDEVSDADLDASEPKPDLRFVMREVRLADIFIGNLMVPREALIEVRGADESLDDLPFHGFQDTDLIFRLFNLRIAFIWDLRLRVRRVEHPTIKPPLRNYDPSEEADFYRRRLYDIVRTGRTRAERGLP